MSMFSRWIKSWRDLPLKINQWANVVRWELRTRPFLRTTEFLWQEGHTAHASVGEAEEMARAALAMYKNFMQDFLAIPIFDGEKTESERFAGADRTFCVEAIMQDGKGLQMGTSHLLSKKFVEAFGVCYQDKQAAMQVPFCSSWGVTTRMIGGLIMTHGDAGGLVLSPKIAPLQVVIVPIFRTDEERATCVEVARKIENELKSAGIRVKVDDDESKKPGAKFFEWELKGVPLRIEIGPRDVEQGSVMVASRLEIGQKGKKTVAAIEKVLDFTQESLGKIQIELFERARSTVDGMMLDGDKVENFGKSIDKDNGVFMAGWCGARECEEKLKPFKGTIRCMLSSGKASECSECFGCSKASKSDVVVAKCY